MSRAVDPFRVTNRLGPAVLDVVAHRLETRGHHPVFAKPLTDYLDCMAIDTRSIAVDLGCGIIGIFDGDYASLTFELGDEQRSRQMDDVLVASSAIGAVIPAVITEVGAAVFWKSGIESYAAFVPSAGLITHEAAAEYRDELMAISARAEFFGSCVRYAYVATAAVN